MMTIPTGYFDYWIQNIDSYSRLIADPHELERAWINKDKRVTSAYDFDELMEQLLDDLRVEEHVDQFKDSLQRMGALEAVTAFAAELTDLDQTVKGRPQLRDPQVLLRSPEWENLRRTAEGVVGALSGAQ